MTSRLVCLDTESIDLLQPVDTDELRRISDLIGRGEHKQAERELDELIDGLEGADVPLAHIPVIKAHIETQGYSRASRIGRAVGHGIVMATAGIMIGGGMALVSHLSDRMYRATVALERADTDGARPRFIARTEELEI